MPGASRKGSVSIGYVLIGLFGFPLVLNLVTLACQQRLNVTWLCFPVVFLIRGHPIRT